jgi:exodeoxyribonuclease V gamma subunit
MLHLVYSSRTESLLEALVADLERHRASRGPLTPFPLVLPNRNVEAYLRFGIARQTGIAANLEVHYLRRFVRELLERADARLRLVDAEVLRGLVLGLLLDDEVLGREELAPVRRYLRAAGESPDAMDLRRFQLADQLALLFEEYGYAREEMLLQWEGGPVLGETPHADTEAWQRALWLLLCGKGGVLARRAEAEGVRWLTLGQAAEVLRSPRLEVPRHVHLFGLSYVARAFQRILGLLASRCELHVYALNPCREFWEDVETERESARRRAKAPKRLGLASLEREDPFGLVQEGDTPALRLWGRPGRESIRLLNELADCDFTEAFPEAPPASGPEGEPTLLERLQWDVLHRAPLPPAPLGVPPDGSVQVLACPGVRREAEAVAEGVWALLEASAARARETGERPLRLNEVAVLVAGKDKEAYFAHLAAAFRACHDVPHNVVDLTFAATSRVAEAVGLLLGFPLGGFSRPEVLRVLGHPVALARFPGADADTWAEWCERLGVVHGADREDHQDTYIEHDALNWDQGLRRLALGAFMEGARGEGREAGGGFALGEELYAPEEVDRGSQPHAVQLAMAARSLMADARFARVKRLPLADWARFMAALLEAHLAPTTDGEARELERCLTLVRELALVDVGGREVSYRIAHELVVQALSGLPGTRGQHQADGVVVSSLRPMRAIPFRAVFVVGAGEGEFPAPDRRNPLDLRAARVQAGDVSAREQDRYTFLETLLCTRERLTVSYVQRDALTGEPLEPSSVVHELLAMLEAGYVGREGRAALVRQVPTHRHAALSGLASLSELAEGVRRAASGGPIVLPESRRESAVVRLRESLQAAVGEGALPDLARLRRLLRPEVRARLDAQLGLVGLGEAAAAAPPRAGAEGKPLRLSLTALRRFLECPLQGHAEFLLGLEEVEEGDVRERQDEPFATPFFDSLLRLRRVFLEVVRREGCTPAAVAALEEGYGALAQRLARAGQAPLGVFGVVEREAHLQAMRQWHAALAGGPAAGARVSGVRLGGAQEGEVVEHLLPPLLLEVPVPARGSEPPRIEPLRVEVVGRIEALTEGPDGALLLEKRNGLGGWRETARRRKAALRAWVEHLALAAAGLRDGRPHTAHVVVAGRSPGVQTYPFAPLSAGEARARLTALAADLLTGPHGYLLPFEAVFLARGQKKGPTPLPDALESVLSDTFNSHSSQRGPVRRWDAFRPPAPDVAEALVTRRFGPFFAAIEGKVQE